MHAGETTTVKNRRNSVKSIQLVRQPFTDERNCPESSSMKMMMMMWGLMSSDVGLTNELIRDNWYEGFPRVLNDTEGG